MVLRSAPDAIIGRLFFTVIALSTLAAGCSSTGRVEPSVRAPDSSALGEPRATAAPAFSLVHAFGKQDRVYGEAPLGGVVFDASGNIFGTAELGGAHDDGVVFELVPTKEDYKIEVVHSFSCSVDGCYPIGSPAQDSRGELFVNTAEYGPDGGQGTIAKLSPSGSSYQETGLYTFTGEADEPFSTPLVYGQTVYALTSFPFGILFGFSARDLQATVLHQFSGADGALPLSGVVESGGFLYGTTAEGGAVGEGTVYRFDPKPGGGEAVLYSFLAGNDGYKPIGNVVLDSDGSIYGTTFQGGGSNDDGVIYKLTHNGASYTESILHTFGQPGDGARPWSGLTLVGHTIWGTTSAGGDMHCSCGTIFSLSTTGTHYEVRHTFLRTEGSDPYGTLVLHDGALYGTTSSDGPGRGAQGVVFKFVP